MVERSIVIPFGDLREVEIKCACGAGIVVSGRPVNDTPALNSNCPGCGESLSQAVHAVKHLRLFYEGANAFAGQSNRKVQFRVTEPE